jgi:hypothetical protein
MFPRFRPRLFFVQDTHAAVSMRPDKPRENVAA